jgi:hypothetical protein
MKKNFREWTLDAVDEAFGLRQVRHLDELDALLTYKHDSNDYEKQYLSDLRDTYYLGGDSWNEVELENKIISPLFVFAKISNERFSYFLERELALTIGDYELLGRVDGMIATGFRNPKKPYFCMNEYKRATDPDGDPQGQALIAMFVAQKLNGAEIPIYGSFIVGKQWHFMVLVNKMYAMSKSFACDDEEIFDIFRILRSLRWHIEKLIS